MSSKFLILCLLLVVLAAVVDAHHARHYKHKYRFDSEEKRDNCLELNRRALKILCNLEEGEKCPKDPGTLEEYLCDYNYNFAFHKERCC